MDRSPSPALPGAECRRRTSRRDSCGWNGTIVDPPAAILLGAERSERAIQPVVVLEHPGRLAAGEAEGVPTLNELVHEQREDSSLTILWLRAENHDATTPNRTLG